MPLLQTMRMRHIVTPVPHGTPMQALADRNRAYKRDNLLCVLLPVSTDGAVNVNASNRITGEANRMVIATVPSQSGSLTYNGSAQTPTFSNYDTNKMTLSVTGQTNAGTYSASFTPKDDYMWSDETTAAKTVNWTINKAAGSLSVSPQTVTLDMEHPTAQITVTRPGNGAITAVSNNTGIVTVSVSGNVITVHNVNQTSGDTTITVKVAAGTNYTAPANKTVTVNAEFVSDILNENSWAVIKAVSDSGQGDNYWDVGDTKTITINAKLELLTSPAFPLMLLLPDLITTALVRDLTAFTLSLVRRAERWLGCLIVSTARMPDGRLVVLAVLL